MNTEPNLATNHGTTACAADAANEENTQRPSDLRYASQKRQECRKSNDESILSNGIDKDPGVKVVPVLFSEPGPLYMDLYSRYDGTGAYVKSFRKLPDGRLSKAQACGEVSINDALYALNDCVLNSMPFTEIIELIRAATFPLVVTFHRETTKNVSEESETSHCTKEEDSHRSWGLNFGQMIDWSAKSDRVMDGLRGASRTASLPSTKTRRKRVKKKFQTNDVKTFLKRMGRSKPSSEKDLESTRVVLEHTEMHQQVSSDPSDKLTDASQKSKAYHTTPIFVAVAWERVKDQHDSMKNWDKDDLTETFHFKWYRKTDTKELSVIKGVHSATYNSTLDDVGCLVACRLTSRQYPELVKILEASFRFEMSPSIENTVQHLFGANCGSFSATLASCDSDHFQIKIDKEQGVQLSKISDQNNDAGLIASCLYHRDLQVLLDPLDSVRFILKVKELGTFLGNKIGDVCDMSRTNLKHLESVSCFFLVAPNPEHRDIIAALIRRIRQSKLTAEEEEKARHDEWSFYMDPAYSIHSAEESISSDGEDSSTRQMGQLRERIDELNSSDEQGLSLVKLFGITDGHLDTSKLGSSKPEITQVPSCSKESILTFRDSKTSYDQDHTYSLKRENEILQEKLMSLSITLKSTEDERETCKALLDVKDQRIEGQQLRIYQLETKLDHMKHQNKVLSATASELNIKSSNLEGDVCRLQSDVQKLQTSNDSNSLYTFASEEKWKNELYESQRTIQAKDDRIRALESSIMELQTVDNGLVAKCKSQGKEIDRLRRYQERTQNSLEEKRLKDESRANKSKGKSSELEQFDDAAKRNGQRVHPESSSRSSLPSVPAADSCDHDKSGGVFGLESLFLGAKGSSTMHSKKKRKNSLLEQNQSLQRVVNELTDALHMQREQMEVLREINSALAAKLAPYTNSNPCSEDTSNS
uniref:Uncharacterized protein AlNc14C263G9847 n=1 Tax=Albugo laibachii Nc14 TaxID=890382 RepID=F0WU24_9STRA|nr:conserved hypothetical protein [Albugo laibachii Nc14]CCA24953.1 conserved hypothetical protein [Albugo laibachii Nc14]|eukprot:CCA24953.1 conserved hypothetical protein [Albugo laibachii Nc14]